MYGELGNAVCGMEERGNAVWAMQYVDWGNAVCGMQYVDWGNAVCGMEKGCKLTLNVVFPHRGRVFVIPVDDIILHQNHNLTLSLSLLQCQHIIHVQCIRYLTRGQTSTCSVHERRCGLISGVKVQISMVRIWGSNNHPVHC